MRRVVVTGMGMVTPAGPRPGEHLVGAPGRAERGRPDLALRRRDLPHPDRRRGQGLPLADYIDDADRWDEHCRNTQFALAAARMAVDHSGLETTTDLDRTRFGVYLGSGEGQQDFPRFVELVHQSTRERQGRHLGRSRATGSRQLHPIREAEQEPDMPAGHLASVFGARGPNVNCLTACAASSQAIGEATEIIRRGDADVMLSGGTHSMIHPFGVTGFNLLTALSTRNDDPTQRQPPVRPRPRRLRPRRRGRHGRPRRAASTPRHAGRTIYGEIVGYGSTADAFRITDTHPEGRGAIACMRDGPRPTPGSTPRTSTTSTPTAPAPQVNDPIETLAIKQAFGEHGLQGARLQHQEHDGPPDRRRRQRRGDRLPAGDPRRRPAADDQLREPRPRLRPRLRPQRGPPQGGRRRPHEQLRLRRPEHRPDPAHGSPADDGVAARCCARLPESRPIASRFAPSNRPPATSPESHTCPVPRSCSLVVLLARGPRRPGGVPGLPGHPLRPDHRPDLRGEAVFLPLRVAPEAGGEEVRFPTSDGLELVGTYSPTRRRVAGRASWSSATST